MTDQEFCEIENQIEGTNIDVPEQIAKVVFNGRELKEYLEKAFAIHGVVGRSEQLKAFKQGETLFLDNTLKVEVITPESSVLVKDSRDNKLMWVEKDRLKRY